MNSLTDSFSKTTPPRTVQEMLLNYAGLGAAEAEDHFALLDGKYNDIKVNSSDIPKYRRRSSQTVLDRVPYEAGF